MYMDSVRTYHVILYYKYVKYSAGLQAAEYSETPSYDDTLFSDDTLSSDDAPY